MTTCPVCGTKFLAVRGGKYCSTKCGQVAYARRTYTVKKKQRQALAANVEGTVTPNKSKKPVAELSVPAGSTPRLSETEKRKTFRKKSVAAVVPATVPTTPTLPVYSPNDHVLPKLPGYVAVVLWPMEHLSKLPDYFKVTA